MKYLTKPGLQQAVRSCLRASVNRLKKCGKGKGDSGRSPDVSTMDCLPDCDESGGPLMSRELSRVPALQPTVHTQTSSLSVNAIEQSRCPGTAIMVADTKFESIKEGHFLGDAAVIVSEAARNAPAVPNTKLPGTERCTLVGSAGQKGSDFSTSYGQRRVLWRKSCRISGLGMTGWRGSSTKPLPGHPGGEGLLEGLPNTKLELENSGDGTRGQKSVSVSSSRASSPATLQTTRAIRCLRSNDGTTQMAYRRAIALRALEQQQMREDERMATRLRGGGCCGGGQVRVDTSPHNQDPGVPTPTRESHHPPRAIVEKPGQPMTSMMSAGSISGGGARSRAQSHVSEKPNPERSRRASQATVREGASVSRQPSQRGTRSRTTSQAESRSRKQSRVGEKPPMPSQAHGSRSRKPSTVPAVPSMS